MVLGIRLENTVVKKKKKKRKRKITLLEQLQKGISKEEKQKLFNFLWEDPETNDEDLKQSEDENAGGKASPTTLEDGELLESPKKRRKLNKEKTEEEEDNTESESESENNSNEESDELSDEDSGYGSTASDSEYSTE